MKSLQENRKKDVYGFDTETYRGYARLICVSDGRFLYGSSIEEILDFLSYFRYENSYNFFYNLRYDAYAILKYLPKEKLEELWKTKRTQWGEYKLKYLDKKFFSITKGYHTIHFYDLMQFFDGSLDTASRKYLRTETKMSGIDRDRLNTDWRYWQRKKKKIIEYCLQDALLTEKLGYVMLNMVSTIVQSYPKHFFSKASISKEYVRRSCEIPNIQKIPREALQYAFNAYKGGRFELIKRGYFPFVQCYDLNSAYPAQIRELADCTKGKWTKVKNMHEKSIFGFYRCRVLAYPYEVMPFSIYHPKHPILIYPAGQFITYLSKREIEAYDHDHEIEILEGWEFFPKEEIHPFQKFVDELYEKKQSYEKGSPEYLMTKIALNSLYGCFYEKTKREDGYHVGKLFNPVYASEITAGVRIQLFEMAERHKEKVISFATDSVVLEGANGVATSEDLGDWDLEIEGEGIFIRPGFYEIAGKQKKRGVDRLSKFITPEKGYQRFSDYLRDHPEKTEYEILLKRPISLAEGLFQVNRFDPSLINIFEIRKLVININSDRKRIWKEKWACGGEILRKKHSSLPIVIE
ncbi:MAG: DNA polymerase [Candidatus Syntropharchaeia archaeon]